MAKNNQIVIKKVQLKIFVSEDFDKVKNIFSEGRNSNEQSHSFESFLKDEYYKRYGDDFKSSIFFVDYKEKSGSFIATFAFLIITTFNSYASIRQGIDTFTSDIETILEERLGQKVGVWVQNEHDITLNQNVSANNQRSPTQQLTTNNKSLLILVLFIFSIGTAIFLTYYSLMGNKEKEDEHILDYEIRKKVQEEVNRQKLDYLFYSKYFSDTLNHNK